jgi:hypothetical protein
LGELIMKTSRRKKLEMIALERLKATADDDERWSFLFRTEGAVCLTHCPWLVTENWEFDGETEGTDLPWSSARLELIKRGETAPNDEELCQWRRAKCRALAADPETAWIAWVVPLRVENTTAGYALFVSGPDNNPDDTPDLKGIFDRLGEAKAALMAEGAVTDET